MSGARISQPSVTYTNVPAQVLIGPNPQKVLMVGMMADDGDATEKTLIHIDSTDDYINFFKNSSLTEMITAFKQTNPLTHLDVIGVKPDSTGSSATGKITLAGSGKKDGKLTVFVGNKNNSASVTTTDAEGRADVASRLTEAINKANLPITAAVTSETIDLTYRYKGVEGNVIGVKIVNDASGITPTLTPLAGGTDSLSLSDVFDVVKGERYQTVIWPFSDKMDTVKGFLEPRWNVTNNVLDGVSITVVQESASDAVDRLGRLDQKTSVVFVNGIINSGLQNTGCIFETPENIAAMIGAFRSLRYTEDALLTQYLTTSAGKDQFGGPALGALPYFNTLFPYLDPVPVGQGFIDTQIEELASVGGSVLGNNKAGTNVILGEVHTTYKNDPAGNPDPTYHYLNAVDVQSIAREYFYLNTAKRFAQTRLTEGGIFDGRDMANEGVIRSFLIGLYKQLAGPDYVIVQAGADQVEFFDDNLIVELDLVKGKISIQMKCCFVVQARTFVGTIEFAFSIN